MKRVQGPAHAENDGRAGEPPAGEPDRATLRWPDHVLVEMPPVSTALLPCMRLHAHRPGSYWNQIYL